MELAAFAKPVLYLGTAIATFSNLTAVAEERGVYLQDHLYGDLGQGSLNQFRSHTIEFTRMQLTVGEYD